MVAVSNLSLLLLEWPCGRWWTRSTTLMTPTLSAGVGAVVAVRQLVCASWLLRALPPLTDLISHADDANAERGGKPLNLGFGTWGWGVGVQPAASVTGQRLTCPTCCLPTGCLTLASLQTTVRTCS